MATTTSNSISVSAVRFTASWDSLLETNHYLLGSGQAKDANVVGTGVEAGEFLISGAANPVIDSAVLFAEMDGSLEHDGFAGLSAIHLDRVLVGAATFTFERRFPRFCGTGVFF